MNAVDAFDYTLALNAGCAPMPGEGGDLCRVHEGDAIDTVVSIVLPKKHIGGEITVNYRSITKTYGVKEGDLLFEIPLKEFFETDHWVRADHNGIALVLAALRFKDAQNIEYVGKARGMAIFVVMVPDYNPMPIDSGFHASETEVTCKVQYSTAGRSAVGRCKAK